METIELVPITPDESPDQETAEPAATRPRTRWAGVVWGLVFAALAVTAIQLIASPERFDEAIEWLATLTPPAITAYALLTIGALVLIAGLVGLLRRAQVLVASRR